MSFKVPEKLTINSHRLRMPLVWLLIEYIDKSHGYHKT